MLNSIDLIAQDSIKYQETLERDNAMLVRTLQGVIHNLMVFIAEHGRDLDYDDLTELTAITKRSDNLLKAYEQAKAKKIVIDEDWDLDE